MTEENQRFAVLCETADYDRPLSLHDLTFGRLLEEVVLPFDQGDPFFVDGVSVVKDKIRRIKILLQGEYFQRDFFAVHRNLVSGDTNQMKNTGQNYYVVLDSVFRNRCEDVTAQVISAFNSEVKPSIGDYLSKRRELIEAAARFFLESMRFLSGA